MASYFGGAVAKATISSAVDRAMGTARDAVQPQSRINWEEYNWPVKHPYLSLIHFDLAELREKKGEPMFRVVRTLHWWWRYIVGILLLNFLNSIVLAGALGSAYGGINVLYSLIGLFIISTVSMVAVYKNYHGLAENSGRSKTIARVILAVMVVVIMVEAFAGVGNINGFAGFAGSRFTDAEASGGSAGGISYWKAMSAIESLLWLGGLGWLGWCLYQSIVGVTQSSSATGSSSAATAAP